MPRLSQVSADEACNTVRLIYNEFFGDRDPVTEPGTSSGTLGNYWTTIALAPDLLEMSYKNFLMLLQPDRRLPEDLRELAILRTAIIGDSKFEYSQHLKVARGINISEQKISSIKKWVTSDIYTPSERAIMAVTDEILTRNMVEDETFDELRKYLSEPAIVELFFVIGLWRMHAFICRALHLEFDNDTTQRMQEVPAPFI